MNVVGKIVAGLEVRERAPGLLDGDVAFEMALHADGVATGGRKLHGIDDGTFVVRMRFTGAMTTFAGDARVIEQRQPVFVFAVRKRACGHCWCGN